MARNLGTIYAELRLRLDRLRDDIRDAETQLRNVGEASGGLTDRMADAGRSMQKAGDMMSKYVTAPLAGVATAAVYTGMQFDDAMARVAAVSGATGDALDALRGQARELGATTRFSASEAAGGMEMLARAGFDAHEIMAAMPGMLDLAAAGAVDLAVAADIVSDTMMAFGESADQAGRYADVFAKAAASANTTVEGLGEAMAYGAASAAAAGMTVEQTAAIMSAFADAGIKGTRAGTTFEAVMRDIRASTEDGALAMQVMTDEGLRNIEVAVYDAEGNMRDLLSIMEDLEEATADLTVEQRNQAMAQIFSAQGMRGANIIMQRGAESVRELERTLFDAGGAAKEMAGTMSDTLGGAMREMRSALEGVFLELADILIPVVRQATEWLTRLARWFSDLPEPVKRTIVIIGAVVAAIGPLLLIFGTLLTMLPAMKAGFLILKGGMLVAMVPLLKIIAIIAAVIAIGYGLYRLFVYLRDNGGEILESLREIVGNVINGIIDWFRTLWESFLGFLSNIGEWVLSVGQFFEDLRTRVGEAIMNMITSVIEWFASLPERIAEFLGQIGEFLMTFFTETLPYWVGYGIGWMVGRILEGIQNVVQFFRELPERVSELLQVLVEWVRTRVEEIIAFFVALPGRIMDGVNQFVELLSNAVQSVIEFFLTLPGRIMEGLQRFVELVSQTIQNVVQFFAEFPGRVFQFLMNVLQRILEFRQRLQQSMIDAARNAIEGFLGFVRTLPTRVMEIFTNLVSRIMNVGRNLANAARSAASNLWSGFKSGLGISSPSYIEEALERIVAESQGLMNELSKHTDTMARDIGGTMGQFTGEMDRHVDTAGRGAGLGADDGLAGQIAEAVYRAFLAAMAESGQAGGEDGGVALQIDGRTFARLIIPYLRSERVRVGEA